MMLAKLDISRAWDETRAILAIDGRLIGSVALATFVLPGTIVGLFAPPAVPGGLPATGGWGIAALAATLVGIFGQLAIIRLALAPPIRVGDALRRALVRLPAYVGASLLLAVPLMLVLGLAAAPALRSPRSPPPGAALVLLVVLLLVMPVVVRFILASPLAVAGPGGSLALLRRSFRLTRGNALRLVGFLLIALIAFGLLLAAIQLSVGALVILLLGKPEPLTIAALLIALTANIGQAIAVVVVMVMIARFHAQLGGPGGEPPAAQP